MEPDLFSSETTVHDLIEAKGRRGAKELAERVNDFDTAGFGI